VPAKKAMGNQRVFLFVGRLEKIKDVPTILKAAKILRENRQAAKILIVGDGSMRNELEDFAKQNNISNVEFAGAVQHDALPSFYNKADFFILPSLSEGMPLSLLEGMACGLPAITSDVPSLSSIVSESNAGMAFAVGNETSLAGAIAKFAKLPAKDYSRLSENARKYAKKFSWDDVAKKINSIYSGL
jgi:glycosyltransferase involved in cell wall biosynthesis